MAGTLVVYYSRAGENYMPGGIEVLEKGHTEYAAEYLAEDLGADLFQIDTVKAYAANYRACCMEAADETRTGARPEIRAYVPDISGYDTVFVCYPCWCGTAPMCVFTFLEHYDFAGKTVAPLCTNEGSGMGHSEEDIAKSCPGARVVPGLSVRGHKVKDSREEITAWAKGCLE